MENVLGKIDTMLVYTTSRSQRVNKTNLASFLCISNKNYFEDAGADLTVRYQGYDLLICLFLPPEPQQPPQREKILLFFAVS